MSDSTAIYIHVPFCIKKCCYCDFYSQTQLEWIPGYVRSLQKEIERRSKPEDQVNTIYFGGGTPSLLPVKNVETILQAVCTYFRVSKKPEITFEVNPGTVDFKYFSDLKRCGINRLSIGVQSFDDRKLDFLGRVHTAGQAENAVNSARKAGFENISLDFIYGLPFETNRLWLKELEQALHMQPSHLSCYLLTIEKGTPLAETCEKGLFRPLERSAVSSLFKETSLYLSGSGFQQYEISNFSRGTHYRSQHNSSYWNMTPYHGFGAAAHSFTGEKRSWNHSSIETYTKEVLSGKLPVEDEETLNTKQKIMEMIMLRLRTLEGIDIEGFQSSFHESFTQQFKEIIEKLQKQGLGFLNKRQFALTLDGKAHLDGIIEAFANAVY